MEKRTLIKETNNPKLKTSVDYQYGFVAAAGRKSDMLSGPETLARFEAHLLVLEGTSQETIKTLLGIGQTAHDFLEKKSVILPDIGS